MTVIIIMISIKFYNNLCFIPDQGLSSRRREVFQAERLQLSRILEQPAQTNYLDWNEWKLRWKIFLYSCTKYLEWLKIKVEIKLKTLHNAHYGVIENLNEKNELKGNDFLLFLNRKPAIKKKVK